MLSVIYDCMGYTLILIGTLSLLYRVFTIFASPYEESYGTSDVCLFLAAISPISGIIMLKRSEVASVFEANSTADKVVGGFFAFLIFILISSVAVAITYYNIKERKAAKSAVVKELE